MGGGRPIEGDRPYRTYRGEGDVLPYRTYRWEGGGGRPIEGDRPYRTYRWPGEGDVL